MGEGSGTLIGHADAGESTPGTEPTAAASLMPSPAGVQGASDLPEVDRAHYEALDEFARGGLGRIVRMRDRRTGRIVAVKEMLGDSDDAARRFAREAMITANLQHPAIVPVYELGRWPTGEPFFAMKLVAGTSFEHVLRALPTFQERLGKLSVLVSVAEALAYAHGQKIIHRDLKPANVLAGAYGETVVIDWGLAKKVGDADGQGGASIDLPDTAEAGKTVAGSVMGTPAYMPPEQARGEPADERADVYAIGAMLYQLIAGHAPFSDRKPDGTVALLALVRTEAPTPLAERVPEAPRDLVAIAEKAMAYSASARYPTAAELAEDLTRFTTGQLVQAHHYDRWTLLRRWLRKNRAPVTVAAVLVTVLAVFGVYSIRRIVSEKNAAEDAVQASRVALGTALYQKGRIAENDHEWARAAMYYAAARRQNDTPEARWAAGVAEAQAVFPHAVMPVKDIVRAVAFSPDAKQLASVDDTGKVVLWSPDDGHVLAEAQIAKRPLHAVAFAPDGSELAVAGDDGEIVRLDGKLARIGALTGHAGRVWSVAYSHDGTMLASGGEDATARVWSLASGGAVVIRGHELRVYAVAFSPDDITLATASDDRTAKLWTSYDGQHVTDLAHHTSGGVTGVAFAPNGDIATSGWGSEVFLTHPSSDIEQIGVEETSVHGEAVTADGRALVTVNDAGAIHVWSLSAKTRLMTLSLSGPVDAVATSSDNRWIATGGETGRVIVWDARGLVRLTGAVGHGTGTYGVSYEASGKTFVSGGGDNTLRVWDASTGAELRRITPAAYCSDGPVIIGDDVYSGCDDGFLRHWDRTGEEVGKVATTGWMRFLAVTPDRRTLIGGFQKVLDVVDVATLTRERSIPAGNHQTYNIVIHGDGTAITSNLDDTVRVYSGGKALELRSEVKVGADDGELAADTSPDGAFLATATQDGRIAVYDLAHQTWKVPYRRGPATELGAIHDVRYGVDGKVAYTCGDDGLRRWDTATWERSELLDSGEGRCVGFSMSPDGGSILAAYDRGGIAMWDIAKNRVVRRIGGRPRGTCDDVDVQAWVDPGERATVADECAASPEAYFQGLAARTHQRLDRDIDLAWEWEPAK